MSEYKINFVEYNEIMELDGNPYEMLLNPITLEQLKEGLNGNEKSYIRNKNQSKFITEFIGKDINISNSNLKINKDEVYIAIRFLGKELPDDFSYLEEDHDIEIYFIKMLDRKI